MRWRRSPRRSGSAGPRAPRPGPAARSPPPLLPLLLLWTAALALGAAAGDEAAPAGASVCYSSPPSVGSVQELAQRAAVVIEGKVHQPRRQQGALDRKAAAGEAGAWGGEREPPAAGPGALGPPARDSPPTANGTVPSWPSGPAPSAGEPGDEAPYLVKVHQVWAVKAGGLKKDSLLTVRLGAWGHPAFPSCGRLKEDSRYIFFMEPDANSSSRAPAAFRASFPPLETGRNLKKEVSRVLCKRCGKFLAPRGALRPGGEVAGPARQAPGARRLQSRRGLRSWVSGLGTPSDSHGRFRGLDSTGSAFSSYLFPGLCHWCEPKFGPRLGRPETFNPSGCLSPSRMEMGRLLSCECLVELGFGGEVLTVCGPPCGGFSFEGGWVSRTGFFTLFLRLESLSVETDGQGSVSGGGSQGRDAAPRFV